MHDFVPEDITTVEIIPRGETVSFCLVIYLQTFYEDVGSEPVYIRGAFFVGKSTTGNRAIDFFVVSPKNQVVVSKRKAEEGIFRFNTTMEGRYAFVFSNVKV